MWKHQYDNNKNTRKENEMKVYTLTGSLDYT